MAASTPSKTCVEMREVEKAIHRVLSDCLPYGFFVITIRGEKNRGKQCVFVEGGQSIKLTMPIQITEITNDSCGGSVYEQNTE